MDDFTSLSTGCFVVKPSKRSDRLAEFPRLFSEQSRDVSVKRFDQYVAVMKNFKGAMQDTLDKVNSDVATQIVSFMKEQNSCKNIGIPTLALKIGANFQEFSPIFDLASELLQKEYKMQCVTVHPSQSTEIAVMLKDVFIQLLSNNEDLDKILIKTLSLKDLFDHIVKSQHVNGMVFFIPRFDVFPSSMMDKMIEICSSRNKQIPLFFVLGLSTGTELSIEWLNSESISQLKVETLSPISPTLLLERVLEKSLLDFKTSFKLSYRTFEVLLSRFSFSSYSLKDVMKTISVALLNHSMQQPLFHLLKCTATGPELEVYELSEDEKALVLQLPSVQKHIEKIVLSDKAFCLRLLQGDTNSIEIMFQECSTNYMVLLYSYKILHSLIKNLPGSSLVSKPLELYSFFLQGCVNEVKEICVALKCFGMLQATEFLSRLKSTYEEYFEMNISCAKINLLLKVIKNQIEEMESVLNIPCNETDMKENADEMKVNLDEVKSIQASFVSRLENYLSTLTAPSSWPMHEILWYTNHIEIQNILVGKCRTALHRGLANPDLYLQGSEKTPKPDICHLYELFQEQGRMISLHDWIQSFNSMLGRKKISNETHAQFISAVSELHFMGYLKPTKRKTDHVAKLSLLGY